MVITIPTLTLAVIVSESMGAPVLDPDDLLRLVSGSPEFELVISDKKKEDNIPSKKKDKTVYHNKQVWDKSCMNQLKSASSIEDAINNHSIRYFLNNETNIEDIIKTAENNYIDIDNSEDAEILALGSYFGLLNEESENESGLYLKVTRRQFDEMLNKACEDKSSLDAYEYIHEGDKEYNDNITLAEVLYLTSIKLLFNDFSKYTAVDGLSNIKDEADKLRKALKDPEKYIPAGLVCGLKVASDHDLLDGFDGYSWDDSVDQKDVMRIIINALDKNDEAI